MNKKYSSLDDFFKVNQGAVESFFRIQLHTWEDLSKLQSDFANLWLECLNAQIQRVATAKNLNDFCATEAGLSTEYSMKFSDNIRKVYETLMKSQQEFMACCSLPESLYSPVMPARAQKPEKSKSLEVDKDIPRSQTVS